MTSKKSSRSSRTSPSPTTLQEQKAEAVRAPRQRSAKPAATVKAEAPAGIQGTTPAGPKAANARAPRAKKAAAPRTPRPATTRTRVAAPTTPEPVGQTAATVPASSPEPARSRRVVTDEDIRVRAYFLSLERGGAGSDVDFWLLAERELTADAPAPE